MVRERLEFIKIPVKLAPKLLYFRASKHPKTKTGSLYSLGRKTASWSRRSMLC